MAADEGGENVEAKVGLISRLLRPIVRFRERPLQSSLLLGGISALVIGGILIVSLGNSDEDEENQETIAYALQMLDEREFAQSRAIANRLAKSNEIPYEESGGPLFVLGSVLFHDAQENPNPEQSKRLFMLAAKYLEQANVTGFPEGRQADGEFLLGSARFEVGDFDRCLEPLRRAIKRDSTRKADVYRMMATAYLMQRPSQPAKALDAIRKHLASPDLGQRDRELGTLLQARVFLSMDDLDRCLEMAQKIPDDSTLRARRGVLEARVKVHRGKRLLQPPVSDERELQAARLFDAALRLLEGEEAYVGSDRMALGQIAYLNGICKKLLGKSTAAETQFTLARGRHFGTPEGLASAVQEAQIQLDISKFGPAVASFQRALRNIESPELYQNEWMPLDELRAAIKAGHEQLMEHDQYQLAADLVDVMPPTIKSSEALRLRAETYAAWAVALKEESIGQPEKKRLEIIDLARKQWKEAGRAFYKLSHDLQTTPKYADYLWSSAASFRSGQNYELAEKILLEYMENESRRRQPRALVALGEAKLATNRPQDAITYLRQCISDHPKHPDSYRARIIASHAYLDLGESDKAISMLEDNLNSELTPDSDEWRKSLFMLGNLFFLRASEIEARSRKMGVDSRDLKDRIKGLEVLLTAKPYFLDGIAKLQDYVEFSERYESREHPLETMEAKYWIAESHRLVAKVPRKQLPFEAIATTRNQLRSEMVYHLNSAASGYEELRKHLNQQLDQRELSPVEDAILRNCYFLRGDIYFDLEDFQRAFDEYSTATNRFPHHPSSLEAFMQMAHCQRRMGNLDDARGTLERAKVVLEHIKDRDFQVTTRYSRQEWEQVIDWFLQL